MVIAGFLFYLQLTNQHMSNTIAFYKPELTDKEKLQIQIGMKEVNSKCNSVATTSKCNTVAFTRTGHPSKVYSPELKQSFTVKELRGNAIYTEEGACLSAKMVESYVPIVIDLTLDDLQDVEHVVNLDHED